MSHFERREKVLTIDKNKLDRIINFLRNNRGVALSGAKGKMEVVGQCPLAVNCVLPSCFNCEARRSTFQTVKEEAKIKLGKVQEISGGMERRLAARFQDSDLMRLRTLEGGISLFQGSEGERGAYVISADTGIEYRRG